MFSTPCPFCIQCYSSEMEGTEMEGKGKLAAFTCIPVVPPFMMEQGYNRNNPYCSGVVELEEGPRVDARIEGVGVKHPENIGVGMSMKVKFL